MLNQTFPSRNLQNQTRIYLDNAATTPLSEVARDAMSPSFAEVFGNASSPYAVSREARSAVDNARAQVAALVGSHADEIAFTSGGTESDNWALIGVALANIETLKAEEKGHFIVSNIEHHAVLEAASTLKTLGFEVDEARADENGVVQANEIARLLKPSTLLVSVMAVNNETGAIAPIEEIGALCRERGVLFHTDAVQASGKIEVNVKNWNCDLLSLSAHKFGGPKGVGALFIRRNTSMRSLLRGGGQERGRRAGTENTPGIVGMGASAQSARENLEANASHLSTLSARLHDELEKMGAKINAQNALRAPHIVNASLPNQRAETLALNLDLLGFAVGTGSACASGAIEPSHVLSAMGLDRETSRASLRISSGVQNTLEEIEEFLETLKKLIHREGRKGREDF